MEAINSLIKAIFNTSFDLSKAEKGIRISGNGVIAVFETQEENEYLIVALIRYIANSRIFGILPAKITVDDISTERRVFFNDVEISPEVYEVLLKYGKLNNEVIIEQFIGDCKITQYDYE